MIKQRLVGHSTGLSQNSRLARKQDLFFRRVGKSTMSIVNDSHQETTRPGISPATKAASVFLSVED